MASGISLHVAWPFPSKPVPLAHSSSGHRHSIRLSPDTSRLPRDAVWLLGCLDIPRRWRTVGDRLVEQLQSSLWVTTAETGSRDVPTLT